MQGGLKKVQGEDKSHGEGYVLTVSLTRGLSVGGAAKSTPPGFASGRKLPACDIIQMGSESK